MPIHIKHINNDEGIEIVATGDVYGKDIIDIYPDIYNRDTLHKQKYQLIDRTDCDKYFVSTKELKTIAELDNVAAKINPNIIIAIISSTQITRDAAEIWKTFIKESTFQTELFDDRKNAIEWIESQLGKKTQLT